MPGRTTPPWIVGSAREPGAVTPRCLSRGPNHCTSGKNQGPDLILRDMPNPFSRSLRSLEADGFRRWTLAVALSVLLLAAWAAWFFLAEVSVYAVTPLARLEVERAVHPIEALLSGRIATVHVLVGQQVKAGDVLVELESEVEQQRLEEQQAKLGSLPAQLAAARDQLESEKQALSEGNSAARSGLEEARARLKEAEVVAHFAEEDLDRKTRLRAGGQLPEVDFQRAKVEAQKQRAAAETLRLAVERLGSEDRSKARSQEAHLAELRGVVASLEGQIATTQAVVRQLETALEHRKIRAPVSGHIAELSDLRIGSVVSEGTRLGALVPAGNLKAVALFDPPSALGRVRAGQPARVRLEGFPWTQYGSVPAKVTSVADEVRDGHIRAELAVDPDPASPIPLQHGLPGTVEVEVERVSPATLVLRAAGRFLAEPAQTQSSTGAREP